jgi:hypothetical protein
MVGSIGPVPPRVRKPQMTNDSIEESIRFPKVSSYLHEHHWHKEEDSGFRVRHDGVLPRQEL